MFAALAYREGEADGRLRRVFGRLFGERIAPVKTAVGQGECFFTASVTPGARIRWDDLFVSMGRLSREMVLPEELEIPPGCGITRFTPGALKPRVVMNTAAALLARLGETRFPVTIVDLRGSLCSLVIPIVRTCANVRIVTANTGLYREICERLMDEYGASVPVCPPGAGVPRSGVVILPFGAGSAASPIRGPVCLAPEGGPSTGGTMLTVNGLCLPEEYERLRPPGLPAELFGAALYEKCSVREIGALTAAELTLAGEVVTPAQAAQWIAREADK